MLIIFDLDDTLIDTSNSITPFVLEDIFYKMKKKGLKVDKRDFKLLEEIDKKSISSKESLKKFLKKVQGSSFLKFAEEELKNFNLDMEIIPRKGALDILEYLKGFSSLALVSIGKEKIQLEKLKKAKIKKSFFDFLEIVKENKMFSYLKIQKETKEKNIWVCGDRVEVDLKPAKLLNFKTIHMNYGRGKIYKKNFFDYQIKELKEIKNILIS